MSPTARLTQSRTLLAATTRSFVTKLASRVAGRCIRPFPSSLSPPSAAARSLSAKRYTFSVSTMPTNPADGVPTPATIHFATGNNKKLQEVRFV